MYDTIALLSTARSCERALNCKRKKRGEKIQEMTMTNDSEPKDDRGIELVKCYNVQRRSMNNARGAINHRGPAPLRTLGGTLGRVRGTLGALRMDRSC